MAARERLCNRTVIACRVLCISERLDPRCLSKDLCSRTMLLQDLGLLWNLDPQDFRSPASHQLNYTIYTIRGHSLTEKIVKGGSVHLAKLCKPALLSESFHQSERNGSLHQGVNYDTWRQVGCPTWKQHIPPFPKACKMHKYLIIFDRREPQAACNTNLRNENCFLGHTLQLFNVVSHTWCLFDLTDNDIMVSVRISDSIQPGNHQANR